MSSPFLDVPPEQWVASNDLAFAVRDGFPVSPGHTLVVAKRFVPAWFDATRDEQLALLELVDVVKAQLDADLRPDGYNVGFNAGTAAGQTVMHLHVHVIPRFTGDAADPRGGVRHVIPGKGNYLSKDLVSVGGSGPFSAADETALSLPATPTPLRGAEPLHVGGAPAGADVLAFWRWSASDLASNSLRGVLAEFIVGHLIGAPLDFRREWDASDLKLADGTMVEVKSAARLQTWAQKQLSPIRFDVAPKLVWDPVTMHQATTASRVADVWVFCVQAHEDRATLDPLNLAQWQFYVLAGRTLEGALGGQKTAGLATLLKAGAMAATAEKLRATVVEVVQRGRVAKESAP